MKYATSDVLELHQVININLSSISLWMCVNKLSLSVKKSEFMVTGNTRQIRQLNDNSKCEINGEHLARMHNMKYLGIQIDECLYGDAQYKVFKRKPKIGPAALSKL